jgi:hypothetical protein
MTARKGARKAVIAAKPAPRRKVASKVVSTRPAAKKASASAASVSAGARQRKSYRNGAARR